MDERQGACGVELVGALEGVRAGGPVGDERDVRVGVDEPRQARVRPPVDHGRAGGDLRLVVAHVSDAIAAHDHDRPLDDRAGRGVEQAAEPDRAQGDFGARVRA